jgi:tRNA pseudouridine13 synthase
VLQAWEKHWQLPREAIGHAGLKDRQAVTTQWISVPASAASPDGPWPPVEGVTVLDAVYRPRKLQAGDLVANRFAIRLRNVEPDTKRLDAILTELRAVGVPNYFGPQRFGRFGDNAEQGLTILRRGLKPRGWLQKLQAQAVQSFVFNEWVARRVITSSFRTVVAGDVAMRHDTGGKFIVQDLETDEARALACAISATGPLLGRKYHQAEAAARQLEDEVLAGLGLTRELFRALPGARRPVRFFPDDLTWEPAPDGFWLYFTLPPGCYATALLREVMKVSTAALMDFVPCFEHVD